MRRMFLASGELCEWRKGRRAWEIVTIHVHSNSSRGKFLQRGLSKGGVPQPPS